MIELTPATIAHADALALIHRDAFPPAERWSGAALAAQLTLPGGFGWIAAGPMGGGLVLARVAADEGEILTLAVQPAARRRGFGRALLDAARRGAAERGAARLFLEVAADNGAARALYAAGGFAEIGRRRAYYQNDVDALVLAASTACESKVG